eukprot:525560-Prorocentrum_minimum.AAC.1
MPMLRWHMLRTHSPGGCAAIPRETVSLWALGGCAAIPRATVSLWALGGNPAGGARGGLRLRHQP